MKKLSYAVVLVAAVSLVGCASNSDLDKVRAMAQQAQTSADAAQRSATAAQVTADQAVAQSADALARAASAENTANETDAKVDRMFKKTMMK
ncbi:MAG: hypothetical protein DRR06_03520 [Gammaproteobacteria bacterium]|nr:MAG: hypothetical protein DRR06_03520 [Gammaproteobacteria bacterium]RLA51244.1 MAG: hypothetical protein DRR42_10865 [Gammaproteobacteria bacterium]